MDTIQQALKELERLPEAQRIAVLDQLIDNRQKKSYIRYFEPWLEQADAIKKFTADKKIFGLLGGNRSGKTILGAFLSVAWALGKEYFRGEPAWKWVEQLPIPEPPNNIWIVGLDFTVLRDVLWYEKLRHGKDHPPFIPQDDKVIKDLRDGDFQVFLQNGSLITGKSADSGREKFQGASVDFVWIDEECDAPIYDECYQRTVDCAGKILLTLTPLLDINSGIREPWVYNLYEDWRSGDKNIQFAQLSTLHSPFITQEEKDRLLTKWTGDPEEGARLFGAFVRRSGLVYPLWDKKKHVIPAYVIPKHYQRIVSIDPAATGVTAAIWVAVTDSGDLVAYREYYEKEKIVSEHAKEIRMRCGGEPVDIWLLDPKWGTQRNAETHKTGAQLWRDANIPVRLPDVGPDYGLHVSREYLNATVTPNSRHPRFYLFEGMQNFEHEITHYTWDTFAKGENKGQSKDKPRKRNDHLLNAWQYVCSQRYHGRRNKLTRRRELNGWDEFLEDSVYTKPADNYVDPFGNQRSRNESYT